MIHKVYIWINANIISTLLLEHLFWTKIAYYKNSLVGAITLSRQLIEHDASLSEPKQSSDDEPLCFRAIILTLA
jgi:hypothetical protein